MTRVLLAALAVLFTLTAGGSAVAVDPPRVLVFGDSIPEGSHASRLGAPHVGKVLAAEMRWSYVDAPEDGSGGTGYGAKNTVAAEEAARKGWPYVDLNRRGWFDGAREASRLHTDNFHPDDEGHRYLGEQLARELFWQGAPRG